MKTVDLLDSRLAINGGDPVRTRRWYDNFTTAEEEKDAAIRVLERGYLSLFEGSHTPDPPFSFGGGPEVQALEEEWSRYYGVKHSISVNSATSGLYAAVGALGLGYGDEVIVSPYTMSACAMAPLIYGAIPVFADVEAHSGCLDPAAVKKVITERTKAILVVHQFGFPADMDALLVLAKKHGLLIIEDCAQAHGAQYKGQPVGTLGDIGVFSLNVNKTIQTGEGGVCTTNDADLAYRLKLIRNHGEAVVGPAQYTEITNIAGYNYRMTELAAAIARVQLQKLRKLNTERLRLVNCVVDEIADVPFLQPLNVPHRCRQCNCPEGARCVSTFYVLPLRFIEDRAGPNRKRFVEAVNAEGLSFAQGYVRPLYLQPVYQRRHLFKHGYPFHAPVNEGAQMNYEKGTCPVAERLHFNELIVSEHVRPPHTAADMDDIVTAIRKVAGLAED